MEEQILHLFALKLGLLDPLSNQALKQFKTEIVAYIAQEMPESLKELKRDWKLTDKLKKDFEAVFQNYFKIQKMNQKT